jgi:hypothetical protein
VRCFAISVAAVLFIGLCACGDNQPANAGADAAPTELGPRVLFVGNSYTFVNDLPRLMRSIVSPLFINTRSEEVLLAGYAMAQHASDARTDGTPLARWLRTGTEEETKFSAVVLQEQSQIGGFSSGNSERVASVAGFAELASLAMTHDVPVVLYQTWGRRNGDPDTSGYETFEAMETRLEDGYLSVGAYLQERGVDVRVAPVGVGFRLVYEAAGANPTADGSEFAQLYADDGSHPSLQGSYLAACIIAGTISQRDVVRFADEARLGAEVSSRLRNVCERALRDPRGVIPPTDHPAVLRPTQTIEFASNPAIEVGASLAMNGDASRIVIGAKQVALFVSRGPQGWSIAQEVPAFRQSVAIARDSNYAIAGSPPQIWHRSGEVWAAVAALPTNSYKFALNDGGSHAVALGGGMNIYVRDGASWSLQAQLPIAANVALDANATHCAIGNYAALPVRAVQRVGDVWQSENVDVAAGSVVAISGDGRRFVAAEPNDARLIFFEFIGNAWRATQRVQGAVGRFGDVVASNADGSVVVAGAPFETSATVFRWRDGRYHADYKLQLSVSDQTGMTDFGAAVSVSSDGNQVAVGAPRLRNGTVSIFTLPP